MFYTNHQKGIFSGRKKGHTGRAIKKWVHKKPKIVKTKRKKNPFGDTPLQYLTNAAKSLATGKPGKFFTDLYKMGKKTGENIYDAAKDARDIFDPGQGHLHYLLEKKHNHEKISLEDYLKVTGKKIIRTAQNINSLRTGGLGGLIVNAGELDFKDQVQGIVLGEGKNQLTKLVSKDENENKTLHNNAITTTNPNDVINASIKNFISTTPTTSKTSKTPTISKTPTTHKKYTYTSIPKSSKSNRYTYSTIPGTKNYGSSIPHYNGPRVTNQYNTKSNEYRGVH